MRANGWLPGFVVVAVLGLGVSACNQVQESRPAAQGERGESCRARNDCARGLACIASTCVLNEYPIAVSARSCELIECATSEDCCELDAEECDALTLQCPRAPGYDDACEALDADCFGGDSDACDAYWDDCGCFETRSACDDGDTSACEDVEWVCEAGWECEQFRNECMCADECSDSVCLHRTACLDDEDCGGGQCVAGACDFACGGPEDCEADELCLDGSCQPACESRNDCGAFEQCVNRVCADVGCATDRECVAFTGTPLARCVARECLVPCQNDAECNPGDYDFEACIDGNCVYIGCQTDEECHIAYMGTGLLGAGTTAVCADAQ